MSGIRRCELETICMYFSNLINVYRDLKFTSTNVNRMYPEIIYKIYFFITITF